MLAVNGLLRFGPINGYLTIASTQRTVPLDSRDYELS